MICLLGTLLRLHEYPKLGLTPEQVGKARPLKDKDMLISA